MPLGRYITSEESGNNMERIDRIMKHRLFLDCKQKIDRKEAQRMYCRHGVEHSLDVARIAYILNLEESGGLRQDLIYAMALLHDLGRSREYETGASHHAAGVELAEQILPECGFTAEETQRIAYAIGVHKNGEETGDYCASLLFRADKLSRSCFDCKVSETCYWTEACRNHDISY